MNEPEAIGAWQRPFVNKLVEQGVSHTHAVMAMALTCDERQKAYMQGYDKGWTAALEQKESTHA
jgi:hypothetical protein